MEGEDQKSLMSRCDLRAFHPPRFPTRTPRKQLLSTEGLTALLGPWASCHIGFWAPTRGRRLAAEGGRGPAQAPCLLPGPCSPVATRPPPCRVPGGHRAPPTPAQVITPEFQGAPAASRSQLKRLQFLFEQKGFLTAHSAPVSRLNERGSPSVPGSQGCWAPRTGALNPRSSQPPWEQVRGRIRAQMVVLQEDLMWYHLGTSSTCSLMN